MESGESGKRRGRKAGRKAGGIDESPRKCTIVLSAKLDWKLDAYASMRRVSRSSVVVELLEEKLGSMVVSFRGPREEGQPVEPPRLARETEREEEAA